MHHAQLPAYTAPGTCSADGVTPLELPAVPIKADPDAGLTPGASASAGHPFETPFLSPRPLVPSAEEAELQAAAFLALDEVSMSCAPAAAPQAEAKVDAALEAFMVDASVRECDLSGDLDEALLDDAWGSFAAPAAMAMQA